MYKILLIQCSQDLVDREKIVKFLLGKMWKPKKEIGGKLCSGYWGSKLRGQNLIPGQLKVK
jgi:hypothetical protein